MPGNFGQREAYPTDEFYVGHQVRIKCAQNFGHYRKKSTTISEPCFFYIFEIFVLSWRFFGVLQRLNQIVNCLLFILIRISFS